MASLDPAGGTERTASDTLSIAGLPPSEPQSSGRLGRYVLIDTVGSGGMGHVLRAYDPKLRREVALKLLRQTDADAKARILREAQAMAQLSHRCVLPVYDVDEHGGNLFIAMELVEGRTLRDWLGERPRTWREVVAVFREAGEGLAAAHAAGIIHRDFKPANVLVGRDDRVRVMDFGLARSSGEPASDDDPSPDPTWLSADLTREGTVMGTPAYMAPEQHEGAPADLASDVYAFCVALYEALYGVRPFAGPNAEAVYRAKRTGSPRPPRDTRSVPRRVHAAVIRGLAVDPGVRWPTMRVLLSELAHDPSRVQRTAATVGGVVLLGLGVSFVARTDREPRCAGAERKLEGVWDEDTRQTIRAAFGASTVSYAPDSLSRIVPLIDEFASRWTAAHTDACEATHVRGEQSEALMDARMRCLDDRLGKLRALARALVNPNDRVVEGAVAAARGLPAVDRCSEVDYVRSRVPPPEDPVVAEEVEALEAELEHVHTLHHAGDYHGALRVAEAVRSRAEELAYDPLVAEAELHVGRVQKLLGDSEQAERTLQSAFFRGRAWNLDSVTSEAATWLAFIVGYDGARIGEGLLWGEHARVESESHGDPTRMSAALYAIGSVLVADERYDDALDRFSAALEILESAEPDGGEQARVLNSIALVLQRKGRSQEALERSIEALATAEREFGSEHPRLASSLSRVADLQGDLGHVEEALGNHQRSLQIREGALGPHHPDVAWAVRGIGTVLANQGDYDRARPFLERVLAIIERARGPDDRRTAEALADLGAVECELGEHARGLVRLERAIEIEESLYGSGHVRTATQMTRRDVCLRQMGDGHEG